MFTPFDRERLPRPLAALTRRHVVRFVVGLIVVVTLAAGYRAIQRRRPDRLWSQAEAALQAGDRDSARIHLQNLLRRNPKHAQALLTLAELELQIAAAAGEPADYAAQPRALQYFAEAARNRPGDMALQRRLLDTYLDARRIREASVVASRVLELDPDHVAALFAATFHAVDVKHAAEAETLLARLASHADRPAFQTLALEAQLALDLPDAARLQHVLDRNLAAAGQLSADQLAQLSADEQSALLQLAALGVDRADSTEVAERRMLSAIGVLQQLPPAPRGRTAVAVPLKPVETAHDLAAVLEQKFPQAEGLASPVRRQIEARLAAFRQSAIASGAAGPKCFRQSAQWFLARGQGDEALRILRQGISQADERSANSPDVMRLHLTAAQYLVSKAGYAEAEPHLAKLLDSKEFGGWGHLLSGNVHLNLGRCDAALVEFEQAEKRLGRTLLVRAALANTYLMLQRWSEALEQLKTLHVATDELSADEQRWYADHLGSGYRVTFDEFRAQLALGRWESARQTIKALEGSELEARAWVLAIGYLLEKDQPQQALEWLAEGRRMFPDNLELLWTDLIVQERTGHREAADALIAAFAKAHGDHLPTQLVYSRWLMEHGQTDAAVARLARLTRAANATPEEAEIVALLYSQALLQAGETERAQQAMAPLQGDARTAAAAGLLAAAAAADRQDWSGVEQAIDGALKSAAQPGALQVLRGELANSRGDYAEAVEALSPALDVTALRSRAQTALHRAIEQLVQTHGLDAAAEKTASLLVANPADVTLLVLHADLEMRRGRFDRSLEALDRLDQTHKTSPLGAYFKAAARYARRELDMAATEIKRAIKIDARHLPSLLLAAQIHLEAGQLPASLSHAANALRIDSRAWDAYLLQAEALKRQGRSDEAQAVLVNTLAVNPEYVAGHRALVNVLAQNDAAAALAACRAARSRLPNETTLIADEVALVARVEGAAAGAAAAERALADRKDDSLRLEIADALRRADCHAEALELLTPMLTEAADAPAAQRLTAHLLAGKICLLLGSARHDRALLGEARDHYAAVLAGAPHHLLAANNLIWLLATQLDEPERAAELAARVRQKSEVEEMPVELIDTLATAFRRAGQTEHSHDLIDRALSARPKEGRLHYQLGMLLFDVRRSDEARQAFEQALRLGISDELAREVRRLIARIEADKLSQRE